MTGLRVTLGTFGVLAMLVACGIWGSQSTLSARPALSTWRSGSPDVRSDAVHELRGTDPTRPRRDLYGNDIVDAIGDYRLDGQGNRYEGHSPATDVATLPPPIS